MKIIHHPQPESLMSCSAGSMPEAFAAVMATHMSMCPDCQKNLTFLDAVGVALFETLNATPLLRDAPVMALRAGEADRSVLAAEFKIGNVEGDVPSPLTSVIGPALNSAPWKRVSAGVWQHVIALPATSRGDLRLIKVEPGQALPEHAHTGSELTMVLKGSYRDATGHYSVGDVADMSGGGSHSPLADPVEGCICLIATDGRLKFKGLVARFMQPLAGF